jgi:hypothetical protein
MEEMLNKLPDTYGLYLNPVTPDGGAQSILTKKKEFIASMRTRRRKQSKGH